MCVRNNYGYSSPCCFPVNEISRFRTMPMDNPILRMLVEKVGNLFSVCIEGERMEGDHTVDLATHCLYFIIVCAPFLPVYHEIKLNPVAVYVTVVNTFFTSLISTAPTCCHCPKLSELILMRNREACIFSHSQRFCCSQPSNFISCMP